MRCNWGHYRVADNVRSHRQNPFHVQEPCDFDSLSNPAVQPLCAEFHNNQKKKVTSMDFIRDLPIRDFFGRGDDGLCHYVLHSFVPGSSSNANDSPLVTILSIKSWIQLSSQLTILG